MNNAANHTAYRLLDGRGQHHHIFDYAIDHGAEINNPAVVITQLIENHPHTIDGTVEDWVNRDAMPATETEETQIGEAIIKIIAVNDLGHKGQN